MNSKWAATDWNFDDIFNAALQRFDEANKNFFKSLIGCVIACSLTKQAQKVLLYKYSNPPIYLYLIFPIRSSLKYPAGFFSKFELDFLPVKFKFEVSS